jgi:RNA polymerase sigma-70 factor (ECF subfamily)
LLLVSWEGLSPTEAATALGERPASFRSRLHRARSRFRRALEQADGASLSRELQIDAPARSKEAPNV